MEEDIKILEDAVMHEREEQEALENLLKAYKELELKVKRYEKYLENKDKKFEEALEYEFQERETDYIPKSKIKEIIEELQKQLKYIACGNDDCDKCFNSYRGSEFIYCFAYHQIKVLKELLEEE